MSPSSRPLVPKDPRDPIRDVFHSESRPTYSPGPSPDPFEDPQPQGTSYTRPPLNTQYSFGGSDDSNSSGSYSTPLRSHSSNARYASNAPAQARPGPNPATGNTRSSSYQPSQSHLRQRSVPYTPPSNPPVMIVPIGTDQDEIEGRNPFADKFNQPVYAAMMSNDKFAASSESLSHATAGMGGDRAEWLPTAQHLYSTVAMNNDDASRALGSSPSSTSSHGANSAARYDIASLSPQVMQEYSRTRYNKETDDMLHDMGPPTKREGYSRNIVEGSGRSGTIFTSRGLLNLGGVGVLCAALVMLFGGYPILSYFQSQQPSNFGAVGLGGTNASGQVPMIAGYRGLIDADTPDNMLTRTGFDGRDYQLVFSDEFNVDGRTFYKGEDPYWQAEDLHYWQTENIEWYDPGNIVTTDGFLEISLTKEALALSHGRGYLGGLITTWNQFCFQGGYIEVAISLPGDTKVQGLWPAAWTMSNLGRAGYGGSLDGNWPFVYEECDVGTLANQTNPNTGLPHITKAQGDQYNLYSFSYLEGQRLSACTCPGELHPGPMNANGSFVGRGASEIDIFEATVGAEGGSISQSGQWAPFNPSYEYINTSTEYVEFFENEFNTKPNTYLGGAYQQVTSGLSETVPATYNSTTNFMPYGFEVTPSFIDGYGTGKITFSQDKKPMWRISDVAMGPNAVSEVSQREVTGEPMYILLNLGMSESFGAVELNKLVFPSKMRIDYVRVYQPNDQIRIGCDPADHPTKDYIAAMPDAYSNPNITTMEDMGLKYPKNRLIDTC